MPDSISPLTVIVSRRIKAGCENEFESAMREFIAFAVGSPGHQGMSVLRPVAGSRDYTVVARFASEQARRDFTSSDGYHRWMERLGELTEGDPRIQELSGMEGWFTLPGRPELLHPPRHKMALVTFLGVYPVTAILTLLLGPLIHGWPLALRSALVSALVVVALTWLVMPRLTKLFQAWLFAENR